MKLPTFRQSMYWLCILLSALGPALGYGWEAFTAASFVLLVMTDQNKQQPSLGKVESITGKYSGPGGDEVSLEISDPSIEEISIYHDAARYRKLREAHWDDNGSMIVAKKSEDAFLLRDNVVHGEDLDAAIDQEIVTDIEDRKR